MQFRHLIVSVFAAVAAAQTATTASTPSLVATGTSAPSATATGDLVSLVNGLPRCALNCLKSAADSIKCNPADLTCLCSNTQGLIAAIGPCALIQCNSEDLNTLTTSATQVCQQVNADAPPAQISSASVAIESALATGATASSSTGTGAAPRRTDSPVLAVMGGAAAAWAVYAI